jgi:putative oxidoreductase
LITSIPLSTRQRRIVWGVRVLLALAFGAAGIAKLVGVPQMVQVFDTIASAPHFFRTIS